MKNFLCILLMFTTTIAQAKNMMCGFDLNGNSFLEQGEISNCTGRGGTICPIGSLTCNKVTDVFEQEPNLKCPSGYVLNQKSQICEKTTVTDSYLRCPNDFSLENGKCKKVVSKDFTPTCPNGFSLQGGRCKKIITQPVTLTCPKDYSLYNGQCRHVATKPIKLRCPSGFALQGNQCRKITNKDVNLSCPVGYTLSNGSCKKTITEAPNKSCPTGYFSRNGQCEKTISQSPFLACPSGFEEKNGLCYKYGWHDPTAYACKDGATLENDLCTVTECRFEIREHIDYARRTSWKEPINVVFVYSNRIKGYWNGEVVFDLRRSATVPAPFVVGSKRENACTGQSCGGGGALLTRNNICKYDRYAPQAKCPAGMALENGRCRETKILPKEKQCPDGWYMRRGQCHKTITTPQIKRCNDGFTLKGSACEKTEYRNPNKSCDSGYSLSGNKCTKAEYQNTSKYCDSGFTISGNSCKKTSYLNATKVCSDGFTLKTNQCEKAIYQEFVKVCDSDYTLNGNKCNKFVYTTPDELCPSGFSKRTDVSGTANKCTKTTDHDPNYLCPTGYSYNAGEGKCKKSVDRNVCPSDPSLPCIDDGFGKATCSPNKCMDIDDPANADIIDVDGKMLVDDGARAADGTCMDSVYIYNGRSMYCKKKGVQSAWQDCCKNKGKVMQDGAGGFNTISYAYQGITKIYEAAEAAYTAYAAATAAGESAAVASSAASSAATNSLMIGVDPASIAIAVAIYLVMEWVANACKKEELETAMAVGSGYCHFVGDYCKKKVKFIGCIQKAKSYCCFNSKLARIIHEQGRPQLKSFDGWGKAGQPNCRGFSPDEFQSIDFSQIDLEEYVNELKKNAQDEVSQDITEITTDFFDKVK